MSDTSGTYTWNLNTQGIINGALRLIGAIQSGEAPDANETQDAQDALNGMFHTWQASGIHLWAELDATLWLQPGQTSYNIGIGTTDNVALTSSYVQTTMAATAAGGATSISVSSATGMSSGNYIGVQLDAGTNFWTTISGAPSGTTIPLTAALPSQASGGELVFCYPSQLVRPLRVPAGRSLLLSSGIETPLIPLSRLDYAAMPNKKTPGTVTQFFFDPQLGFAQMYVWPAPQDYTRALRFTAQRPLQDFATGDYGDIPQEWIAPLRWNLAAEIAPEYDVPPDRFSMIKAMAAEKFEMVSAWDREPESVLFGVAWDPSQRTG